MGDDLASATDLAVISTRSIGPVNLTMLDRFALASCMDLLWKAVLFPLPHPLHPPLPVRSPTPPRPHASMPLYPFPLLALEGSPLF